MANTTSNQTAPKNFFTMMANPVIRKMEKNGEFAASTTASYSGIAGKTVFFLLVTIIGVLLCLILHNVFMSNPALQASLVHVEDTENGIYNLTFAPVEGAIMAAVLLISLITPFLAFFIRSTIPVTGTIYSIAQGMLIGYITVALAPELKFISILAALITLALVGVMLFIYAKQIIKVTARFRGIVMGMFFGMVLAGIIFFILNLIPAVRNSVVFSGINAFVDQPVIAVGISVIYVIFACLFMLADFDSIQRCVDNQMDKKYEWMAAWGLAYTILYIYFKILRILLILFGNSRSSSK